MTLAHRRISTLVALLIALTLVLGVSPALATQQTTGVNERAYQPIRGWSITLPCMNYIPPGGQPFPEWCRPRIVFW